MALNIATMSRKLYCLVLITRRDQILLGFKKRGFGMGKWNGFGGKVEIEESPLEAAIRELKEESNLTVKKEDMKKVGFLEFTFVDKPTLMEVHVFHSDKFVGTPSESDEMRPQWIDRNNIPYNEMWEDDEIWYPMFFNNQLFRGHVHFKEDKMLYHSLKCVNEL